MNSEIRENSIYASANLKKSALLSFSGNQHVYFYDIIPFFLSSLESQRHNYSPAPLSDNLLKSFSVSLPFSHVHSPHRLGDQFIYAG